MLMQVFNIPRIFLTTAGLILLCSCTTYEYHETRANQLNRVVESPQTSIQEETLLDVGIVLFDPGVDVLDEESMAYANVRRSESVWYSQQLKNSLEQSNAWGIVRTLPNANSVFDLTIKGTILESNGEDLEIKIEASDASGQLWLSKNYFERVSHYAYHPEVDLQRDAFQNLFNNIANDLFDLRTKFSDEHLINVRQIAKVRFAQEFAPAAFSDYLEQDDQQLETYSLVRIPAANDPMLLRTERIRARNDLFLDVIQDYYRVFNNNMIRPYDEWRKLSYKEVLYQRQLAKQAKQERIAGVAIIVSGVLAATGNNGSYTRAAGHIGIITGADIFSKSFQTEKDASMHAEALREFGESLELELEPSVIDLQERSVTLTGTVDDQFKEWRRILQRMFEADEGLSIPLEAEVNATFDLDQSSSQTKLQINQPIVDRTR